MRIVHVSDCYLPRLGGIETHVADLAHHQQARGHDVHVVTRTAGPDGDGPSVHRIAARWVDGALGGSSHAADVVADLQPDAVHCHNSVLSPMAVSLAARAAAAAVPTAITVHSLLPSVGPILPLSGVLLGVRGTTIAWSAVSEVAAGRVRRVLGPGTVVSLLPNAVDLDWWRAGCGERESAADELVFVSVGRLALRKRPLPLVRMMAQVRALVPRDVTLRLVLVGDGPQRGRVAQLVRDMGMAAIVELPGQLSRREVRAVLAGADAYVAPADLESFGIAALEARALGLPVVAKRHGGVSEFVTDGADGILADTDADMVRALADLAQTPQQRRALRDGSRQAVPPHGWDVALVRTQALYQRAADLAGRPAAFPTDSAATAVRDVQVAT